MADKDEKKALASPDSPEKKVPPLDLNAPIYNVKNAQEKASLCRVWLVSSVFLLPSFSCGFAMTFGVTGLPHYQKDQSPEGGGGLGGQPQLHLDEDEGSWFVSILSVALMLGTLCSGCVTEKLGCLWTLRLSLLMEMAGWAAIFRAGSFVQLMAGRVLTGLGSGLSIPCAYLVLSDLSLIKLRGILAVLNSSSNNLGWLVGLLLGKFCPLDALILSYSIPAAIFLLLSPFLPESPLWLTKQGKDEQVNQVLKSVRGPNYPCQVEAKELYVCVMAEKVQHAKDEKSFVKVMTYYLGAKQFVMPLVLLLTLSVIQGACGVDTISYYSLKIFKRARIPIDEYLMSIFLQVGYTAGYFMISPFMEKINRRRLFITACTMMGTSLSILAISMPSSTDVDVKDETEIKLHMQLIPPISVIMFSVCYGAGFGPAIYTWSSELFPPRGRNVGCSISLSVRYIVVAGMLKIYPWLLSSLGLSNLFLLHAAVLASGAFFVCFTIPETRGLSLTELATLFGGQLANSSSSSSEDDGTPSFVATEATDLDLESAKGSLQKDGEEQMTTRDDDGIGPESELLKVV